MTERKLASLALCLGLLLLAHGTARGGSPPDVAIEIVRPFTTGVHGMAFAPDGSLYYSDSFKNQGPVAQVYKLAPELIGTPQATGISGATVAGLLWDAGQFYVCVTGANQVRRYDAGLVLQESWTVSQPWNVERVGLALFAVTNTGQVVRLNTNGTTTPLVSGLLFPFDLAQDGAGGFWVSEQVGTEVPGNVRRYDAAGQRLGLVDHTWDNPEGLEVDGAGRLYVADTGAGVVARVLSNGEVETITDSFALPIVVARHPDGNLYFNTSGAGAKLVRIALAPAGGRTPDGSDGEGLTLEPLPGGELGLSWGPSCSPSDTDYAIYAGTVGDFAATFPLLCSTAGATQASVTPPAGDAFFLVVPHNGTIEGSYGLDGQGLERPASPAACFPQATSACE